MKSSIGATFVSSEKLLIVNHLMFALVFNLTMCMLSDSSLFDSLSRNSNNSKFTATNTREIAFCTHLIYYRSFSLSSYIYSFSLFIFFMILANGNW